MSESALDGTIPSGPLLTDGEVGRRRLRNVVILRAEEIQTNVSQTERPVTLRKTKGMSGPLMCSLSHSQLAVLIPKPYGDRKEP